MVSSEALAATRTVIFQLVVAGETDKLIAERWQRAKAIVADALEEQLPDLRAELIAERCRGDLPLLREVESLLAQTTSLFDVCAEEAGAPLRQDVSLSAGHRIGNYVVVCELGRGGMGAVYLAERADGAFEKQVAIKILKRGTDTDEVLRRFGAERQILARLTHPNIAGLLDAGTTEDGLPYFVMDYVVGAPITKYAEAHRLSLTERLKLFRAVCSAVSYAHQNLIIHRDLKPSNVFVTNEGEVKLLDFGIAKLLDESTPDVTLTLQRRMTPEYASPEQVRGEPVTTVSDVYSLGVFLYELLTGERPYKLKRGTAEEITKAICEQEPERPSTAITRSTRDIVDLTRWQLRGDLDNIVLKALRKEPDRRYASVDQFSADVRRHLEGLPVRARKDTTVYRASKFVRRHKLGVAAAILIALVLIGGSITTAWQAHRARLEKDLAQQRFEQVRKLAHSVLFDYHDAIAALPGSTSVRQKLVRDALDYLDNLSKQASNDTSLLRELAAAYEKVATVQGGISVSSHGIALSTSNLGDTQGAIENLNKALAIRQRVAAVETNDKAVRQELAYCYEGIGVLYVYNGPPSKAVENLSKAGPILEALAAANPTNEDLQFTLNDNYQGMAKALGSPISPNLGDTNGAIEYMNKGLPIIEKLVADHPTNLAYKLYLAGAHNAFGWVLGSLSGKLPEALEHAQKARALYQELVKADPSNTLYRNQLVNQLGATGRIKLNMGDSKGALELFKQGLTICESILNADPRDAYTHKSVALAYRNVSEALSAMGDHASALTNFHKSEQMFAELVAKDPTNVDSQTKWSYVYLAMSKTQSESDDLNGAIGSALKGIEIDEALLAKYPANALVCNTLAQLYESLGTYQAKVAGSMGSPNDKQDEQWRVAKEAYQKSLDLYQDMKNKKTLSVANAKKPDELMHEIANCNAALKR